MATMNNEGQKYLAEIQRLENFADRKKVVKEWLYAYGDEENYDALNVFFERLFVQKDGKAQAILAYFKELHGVDDEAAADYNTGDNIPATGIIGTNARAVTGLSTEFVQEMLAAKDKQINTLMAILSQSKTNSEATK